MVGYSLSRKAANDLESIFIYTLDKHGATQAREYLLNLHDSFQSLAEQPVLGRTAEELAPGLQRFKTQSHVIFYLQQGSENILVVRVLHEKMDFERHV